MDIVQKPFRDREVDGFSFRLERPAENLKSRLRTVFSAWMAERAARETCDCTEKHLQVMDCGDPLRAEVLCGWYCEVCLPLLATEITAELPEIVEGTVGHDGSPFSPMDHRFIRKEGAVAHFENGTSVTLPPFEICKSPVTIGQFDAFTAATGYRTTMEKREGDSFRFDETIEPIREPDRPNIPVHNVSFRDALAYCDWAGVRLPTEAELLAASLIDQRVMGTREADEFLFGAVGRFDKSRFPDCLHGLGSEYVVAEGVPPGFATVRRGPYYVRETGWNVRPEKNIERDDDYCKLRGFRVCRLSVSDA